MRTPILLACVLLASACSSNSSGIGGDAGSDGSIANDMRAQGSVSGSLVSPSTAGNVCPNQHTINIPFDATKSGPTTSASSRPAPAIDGEGGQTITCKVQASGAAFAVTGTLYSPGNDATIEVSVVIGSGQDNIPGAVAVTDGANRFQIDDRYTPSTCAFSVKGGAGENLSVSSGKIWGKMMCTNLGIRSAPVGEACNLGNGYFILENCDR
jgi:hypothetical protein